MTRLSARRTLLFVTACLAGCGGGGGGGSSVAGIDGGGLKVQGPISQFGSIFVNGVEYSTSTAAVWINGNPATDRDLRIGQIVTLSAFPAANGALAAATRIDYAPTIEGPVLAVDAAAYTLVVAGVTVRIVANTTFAEGIAGIDALQVNDFLEISGYYDGAGTVIASRVERRPVGDVAVRGPVAGLDAAAKSFTIGALTIDYSGATLIGNFPTGGPANGDFVEAVGTLAGSTLRAARLELDGDPFASNGGDQAEVEGAITQVGADGRFDVGPHHVATSAATVFEHGTAANLTVGAIVEVDGTFDSAGTVNAERIQFRQEGELELTAAVDAVHADQHTFELLGTTIAVDALTRFEDDTGSVVQFSLASIVVGDYLEVRAYQSGGQTIATRVTREPAQAEVDLRGVPTAFALPQFTLLGQAIVTGSATQFRNGSDDIDQATFFLLATGSSRVVRVKGAPSAGTNVIQATEVRLED